MFSFARFSRTATFLVLGVLAAMAAGRAAEPSARPTGREMEGRDVAALVTQLDSNRYETRQLAANRLEELVVRPELGPLLAAEFQRALRRPDVSFEVRYQLSRWQKQLPKAAPDPPRGIAVEEIERLVAQLDDDSYAVRLGAGERLIWAAGDAKLTLPIMTRLKQRLADPALSTEACRRFDDIFQVVRGQWLVSDPTDWKLPPVSQDRLRSWIDELARPGPDSGKTGLRTAQQAARQELLDLLARDAEVPRVKAALESRLSEKLEAAAAARLQELLALTRPAMVVEFWQRRRQTTVQHLLVGVPDQPPGAAKPVQFNPVNDKTARCVSANTLTPGKDYPIGRAFPHPRLSDCVFHLVSLPTPRRRMTYACEAKNGEAERLAAISRRTLEHFLAEKHPLSDDEIGMLAQLDAAQVSGFAGRYFGVVDDAVVRDDFDPDENPFDVGRNRPGGLSSRHGMICAQLAADGTKEAVPGLLEAIAKDRFLPPTAQAPYRLHWLAALAIAGRDPWPEVNRWLAGVLVKDELLILGRAEGPELGATAAAILLQRRDLAPSHFGLQATPDALLATFGIPGHRFVSSEARGAVRAWWEQQREKLKTP